MVGEGTCEGGCTVVGEGRSVRGAGSETGNEEEWEGEYWCSSLSWKELQRVCECCVWVRVWVGGGCRREGKDNPLSQE